EKGAFDAIGKVHAQAKEVAEFAQANERKVFTGPQIKRTAFIAPADAIGRNLNISRSGCRAIVEATREDLGFAGPACLVGLADIAHPPGFAARKSCNSGVEHQNSPDNKTESTKRKERLSVSVSTKKPILSMQSR